MEKEELKKYREAGRILSSCLREAAKLIKPGVPVLEVCEKAEELIRSKGGLPAFPAQVSKNSVAAHYCPLSSDQTLCEEGDLVKLDVGVHLDGYIADSAVTVNLGDHDQLVKASKEALREALKEVRPGARIAEVGRAIQEVIESYGFAPVRNLSGHGLGRYEVHVAPSIPNYDTGSDEELEEGDVVAVEPFASTGAGVIYESSPATVFSLARRKPVRSFFARKLLSRIEAFKGLPFTTRWLSREGEGMVRLALNELVRAGVLQEHPPLVDKAKGLVSQAEHTVVVLKKPLIITEEED